MTTSPDNLEFDIKNSYFIPNPCDESFEVLKNYQNDCYYDIFFAMSHGVNRGNIKKETQKPSTGVTDVGTRLDRVNPYEFRKGMDVELTSLGVSRLAESTPEEREKATETVLKNLEEHGGYYSAFIHYETEFRNSDSKPNFKTFLKEFYEENNMKEVNKSLRENKKQLKRDQKALKKLDRKK